MVLARCESFPICQVGGGGVSVLAQLLPRCDGWVCRLGIASVSPGAAQGTLELPRALFPHPEMVPLPSEGPSVSGMQMVQCQWQRGSDGLY